ncbi:hypothetical protein Q31b_32010 [Novipirellula aureliae]|uniref:Uncharacterized protein n=1 Tax=Novipirellula aureliae TaxID=2527966 RepID=A0A5C6DXV5_9BACT|nr:hypothetical protein [Novipirellula aureliae]TWU39886.1 hypothetical protein Q31b_32010 [Novipirellula aureliae]
MISTPSSPNVDYLKLNCQTLDDWLGRTWQSDDLHRAFASGVLDGARDALLLHNSEKTTAYAFWLEAVNTAITNWRFADTDDDAKDFPISAICGVLENEPAAESRSTLFHGFSMSFVHLMQHGSLGVFSSVHHIIGEMIDGRSQHSEPRQQRMAISNETDAPACFGIVQS